MKPHALRRGLWLSNLGLAAAVIGLGAWYATQVRPAVASVVERPRQERPKELEALRAEYEKKRVSGLKWKPQAPVSDEELDKTILHPEFDKLDPKHWIFSGPLPPTKQAEPPTEQPKPPLPKGLKVLGKVSSVISGMPEEGTMLFKFNGGKSRAFAVGDFVRLDKDEPGRFRLTKILRPSQGVYEIHYEVYGPDGNVEGTDVLRYDTTGGQRSWGFLRTEDDKPATPGEQPVAEAGDGTAGAATPGEATPGEATPGEATPGEGGEAEEKTTAVIDVAGKKPEDITIQDLEMVEGENFIEVDSRRKIIKPGRNTYDYLKHRGAESIAQKVKTDIAKDSSGRTIGLRITGMAEDAPADVFDVRKGDILVSINGQKITSRAQAVTVAKSLKDAKIVTVVIDRRGQLVTYRVDAQDPRNRRKVRYFEGFGE